MDTFLLHKILRKLAEQQGSAPRSALSRALSKKHSTKEKNATFQEAIALGYIREESIPQKKQGKPLVIYLLTPQGQAVFDQENQRIEALRQEYKKPMLKP